MRPRLLIPDGHQLPRWVNDQSIWTHPLLKMLLFFQCTLATWPVSLLDQYYLSGCPCNPIEWLNLDPHCTHMGINYPFKRTLVAIQALSWKSRTVLFSLFPLNFSNFFLRLTIPFLNVVGPQTWHIWNWRDIPQWEETDSHTAVT